MSGDASIVTDVPRESRRDAMVALPLSEGGKQLGAWTLLALINQALILVRLPRASFGVTLLHHVYDFGQLLAIGTLSFGAVVLAQRLLRLVPERFARLARPALIVLVAFAIAYLVIGEETDNFAERFELGSLLVRLCTALIFATALVAIALIPLPTFRLKRPALLLAGGGLGVANAYVLEGDYPAFHFMVAWCASQLLARGIDGLPIPPRVNRSLLTACAAAAGAASLATLFFVPRSEVLRRLYSLSSSAAAPIVARFTPERSGPDLGLVPAEYQESPWFKPRDGLPAVPPTKAFQAPERPIVILLTIDAVRADVLSKKSNRKKLPVLSALMDRAVYFSQARSPSPSTVGTMTSVFSGKYYSGLQYERVPVGSALPANDRSVRFPALLDAAGVPTMNVIGAFMMQARHGAGTGFAIERMVDRRSTKKARDAMDIVIAELEELGPSPGFVWTHFIEPHAPYDAGGTKGTQFERYLKEVQVVDEQIGRLQKFLEESGLDERTILIISSDHGEAFGEHGTRFHARTVYEELLRVPLIIQLPGVGAREVKTPVTLMDLGPTILDLFDLPTPAAFMGESLVPMLVGRPQEPTRPIAADSSVRKQALYLKDGKKVILDLVGHTVEVYDLERDPKELHDLLEQGVDVTAAVETARFFFEVQRLKKPGWVPPFPISRKDRE